MLGWFRSDPRKKLEKRYEAKMREAKEAEKFGDRALQARLYAEAQALLEELEGAQDAG